MKRILLIDDDMDDSILFGEALRQIDDAISFAYYYNGKEALQELVAKKQPPPDLIFLDINMPLVSGWQCLEALKEEAHLKNIPVIMYTTSSRPKEMDMAQIMGASGYIIKPDDFKILKKLLETILQTNIDNLAQILQDISR